MARPRVPGRCRRARPRSPRAGCGACPGAPGPGRACGGGAAAGKGLIARARPAPGMGRAGSRSRGGCGRPSTSPAGLLPHRAPRPRPLPVTPAPGGLVAGETLPGRKAPRPPAQSPSPRELPAPGPAAPRGDLPPRGELLSSGWKRPRGWSRAPAFPARAWARPPPGAPGRPDPAPALPRRGGSPRARAAAWGTGRFLRALAGCPHEARGPD